MKRGTLIAVTALLLTGCGSEDEQAPAACLGGKGMYLAALESAPGEVRLEANVAISDCLVEAQDGGELGQVGEGMVAAATELNRRVQRDPAGDATTQLGYLLGAVQEAASTTGGIHEDLVLRLDSAARFSAGGNGLGAAFERTFGQGYAAGQASG